MKESGKLKREIGVFGLAAGVINFIVGAGIFALPALVFVIVGNVSILAYLLCGLLLLMIMLCFAEIGSQVTVSGGVYAYIQEAFGPYVGFLSNILYWFAYAVLADAAIANAMADMLALQFAPLNDDIYRGIFFFAVFGLFSVVNIIGVKQGVRMVKLLTAIKLVPLVLLVIIGLFYIDTQNLSLETWPGVQSFGEASILLFFAFGGGEGALSTSGEIKNPQRVVLRGLALGTIGVITLYIAIQLVCQGIIGQDLINFTEAPLAEAANRIIGPIGITILVFAAAISIFSTLSGSIMHYPRILYAGAESGIAPAFLAKIHSKYSTPIWAILTYAFLDFFFSITGGFEQLAKISSAALLLIYLGVVLATIKLRRDRGHKPHEGFTIPGGYTIPVISIVVILWFLYQLSMDELMRVVVFFLILSGIYLVMEYVKKISSSQGPK